MRAGGPARRRRWWPGLAGVLLIAVPASAAATEPALAALLRPLDLVGYPARTTPPDFASVTPDGRPLALAGLRGRVVLVNFWASWCPACRPEMPVFERLHRELGPRGLAVVGVNVREEADEIRRYAAELGLSFAHVLDPDGKIGARYGVVGIPTTFLIARDGRAVAFAVGPRDWESAPARRLFEVLLAEPAPAGGPR
jgi:cytochrome c biogenesis protein CcmG/thiol:disulfide interchange protein DsbE